MGVRGVQLDKNAFNRLYLDWEKYDCKVRDKHSWGGVHSLGIFRIEK